MPSTIPATTISTVTAQTTHDVATLGTQSVASVNTQQSEQKKDKEAGRLYEERTEEEYAKREGGAYTGCYGDHRCSMLILTRECTLRRLDMNPVG
jgi:hypothetical protein